MGHLPSESSPLADFRCFLYRSPCLLASDCGRLFLFFLFGYGFGRRRQFHFGLFCRAMVAMLQRLNARRFFFCSELSVGSFLALFLKVFRDRLSCHGLQCGRMVSRNLSCFGHSVRVHGPHCSRQKNGERPVCPSFPIRVSRISLSSSEPPHPPASTPGAALK